jgi:hypothetical protein
MVWGRMRALLLKRHLEGRRSHGWRPFFFLFAGYISPLWFCVVPAAGHLTRLLLSSIPVSPSSLANLPAALAGRMS